MILIYLYLLILSM